MPSILSQGQVTNSDICVCISHKMRLANNKQNKYLCILAQVCQTRLELVVKRTNTVNFGNELIIGSASYLLI